MLDLDIQKKLEVLELAKSLSTVSEPSRLSGVSRDTIYRHHRLIREGGIDALKRQINTESIHGNRTSQDTPEIFIQFSLKNPHLRQLEVANQLWKLHKIELSASGVGNIWLREKMQTIAM
jgi:hypothetical protein